ncbi:hypothetical protein D3C87_1882920 [compost metagenome]
MVADDVAVRRDRHEMLGAIEAEIGEGIDAVMGEKLLRIRPFDDQFVHMVRLVEENGRIAPGRLLRTPVGKLGRHDGVYIDADAGIAQQTDRIGVFAQNLAKTGIGHGTPP